VATAAPAAESAMSRPPASLGRRLRLMLRRPTFFARLEIALAALAILLGLATYAVLAGKQAPAEGFAPPVVSLLLVANLIPVMGLIVLIARRIVILLADRREGRAGARLQLRLVSLFAVIAAVPTLMVVAFAALLFQYGVQFWFSDRARTILSNADQVAQAYLEENRARIAGDILAMGSDLRANAADFGVSSPEFAQALGFQVAARNLSEAIVFEASPGGQLRPIAAVGADPRPLAARVPRSALVAAALGEPILIASRGDRVEALVQFGTRPDRYALVSRAVDRNVVEQVALSRTALSDYRQLVDRSRVLQWRFNLMLVVVSLLLLAAAIWAALRLARRLAGPIGQLVQAAERVGEGDLSARVRVEDTPEELSVLARTFNRMTGQLGTQQQALIDAREQIDARRKLTEAVLTGVSAGVLALDEAGVVKVINQSAAELLGLDCALSVGQPLAALSPELAAMLPGPGPLRETRGEVVIPREDGPQTLAVRVAREAGGFVLTFDDISQQLADQRRAAWADVARKIAHEIKNPLTPIQLSAERLQRRYGAEVTRDPGTFAQLTGTIVRQVGELRRLVDEFSDFARMPRPEYAPEDLVEIAREALLMQELAHPDIDFRLEAPEAGLQLPCDRRQIGRALTNLLKNAAESVAERQGERPGAGLVRLTIAEAPGRVMLAVADNGQGLPADERHRLTEPYVTTRARGTGLGLAIVKRIVEDHAGTLSLADAPEGGAVVTLCFDRTALARLAPDAAVQREAAE
jgi:two-component system nitrogen regulation sensor histidine kinase NtrY